MLWSVVPLWLLAFGAARLMEHAPFASLWFPPTAISFAAIAVFGARALPPILLAAMLGHLWTMDRLGLDWNVGAVVIGGLGFALAHTLPMAWLALALRRRARREAHGRFGPGVVAVLLGGGALACLLTALGGSVALVAAGLAETVDLRWSVVPWMIGDYAGLLALGPLLVEAARHHVAPSEPRITVEAWASTFAPRALALLLLIAVVMGLASLAPDDDALVYAIVFALAVQQWISHTQSPLQTLAALALAALTVAVLTPALDLGHHALPLQFAIVGLAITSLSALSLLALRNDNRRLAHQLETDPLTLATSREHFARLAGLGMADARSAGGPFSLLMLDLDHLKHINDTDGHGAGDEALRRFASVCREHLRADDALGRLGGDEFAMCLPGLGEEAASTRAQTLLTALGAASAGTLPLTASIGVAQMRAGDTYESLVQRADAALMRAKRNGRGRLERS